MGDRVSISFIDDHGDESVAFFSHWDGMTLVDAATQYVRDLKTALVTNATHGGMPLTRFEPQTVMVDFLRDFLGTTFGAGTRVQSNYYLGRDERDGDNSDNGHHRILV